MSLTDLNLDLGVGGAAAVDGEEADQEDINLLRCIYILQDGSEDGMRWGRERTEMRRETKHREDGMSFWEFRLWENSEKGMMWGRKRELKEQLYVRARTQWTRMHEVIVLP